jgi:hypothetical protein
MSIADWYVHKAQQCGRMAKEAGRTQLHEAYKHEEKLWLEIAAAISRDEEKRFDSRPG